MEFNFFRAPSIPKLGTRRISSSIFGGGGRSSTPKLNVRNFSFSREEDFSKSVKNIESALKEIAGVVNKSTVKIDTLESKIINLDYFTKVIGEPKLIESIITEYGELNDKNQNITKTLVETNKILVEIQKQLAYDFALRIADEKEAIKRAKAAESKRKFAAKEKSVEGIKKFGSFAENIVDRVTAPIKSVFDRIKEFFGLILTGIVTNAVFTWLGDPENRKKLNTIFDWVGKIFVGLLLGVITAKFIKWGNRLFKLVRFFWRLPGRIINVFKSLKKLVDRILGKKAPTTQSQVPKTSWWEKNTKSLSRSNASYSKFIKGTSNFGDRLRLLRRGLIQPQQLFTKGGITPKGTLKGFRPPKTSLPSISPKGTAATAGGKLGGKLGKKALKVIPFLGSAIAIIEGIARLKDGDIMGAMLSFGTAIPVVGWGFLAADIVRAITGEEKFDNAVSGKGERDEIRQKYGGKVPASFSGRFNSGGTIKASNGMTVPGRGSKNVDSVNALLAPGEEVIRATSAMMYRPLLKDINDNSGRLWDGFSRAIGKLASVSEYQKEVSKEYSKVIKDFDEYLKQEINKKETKTPSGGGGTRRPKISSEKVKQQPQINTKVSFSSQQTNVRISSSPKITNVNMTPPPSSGGGMTFLPMVLPTQKSKPPQIPTPQNTATDVPFITSVNMSNPYMQLTPEMYGIFV